MSAPEDAKDAKARDAALQGALAQIERQFGKGTVMRMGDEGAQVKVDAIPTGALSLDLALGIGGMPRGRIVEVFGPESSGKTTLVYHVIAEAQKLGGVCAFIDAEHAMDPLYAKNLGVDIDELLVSQPDYGEQALEIADMLVRSGAVDVVAVDSVAALTPRAELEGQMGDQTVGVQARMMSQAMRKLAGNLNRTQTLCLFVNQIREKVGVMFGSPETQPGGRALKFYSSQRLDIRRIETLKEGTEAVGNRVRVKVVKNKVAAPFRQAEFDIEFGKGISSSGCILDLGIEHSIVTKSGSFFSYGDERLGQGRNNAKAYLDEHQEIAKEIEAKVYEALGLGDQDLVQPIERDEDAPRRSPEIAAVAWRRWRGTVDAARSGRCRPGGRGSSTRATSPGPRSTGASTRSPSCARMLARKRVEPAVDRRGRRRALRAGLPRRRRASPTASPRTAGGSTAGARSGSSGGCARSASTASSIAAAVGDAGPRGRARGGRWRCCAAASRSRRRRRATASARSACSSARATSSSSRTTRSAATRASRPSTERTAIARGPRRYYDPAQRQAEPTTARENTSKSTNFTRKQQLQ